MSKSDFKLTYARPVSQIVDRRINDILRDAKPRPLFVIRGKPGKCRVCGAEWKDGPANQRYCSAHSASIRYVGRST